MDPGGKHRDDSDFVGWAEQSEVQHFPAKRWASIVKDGLDPTYAFRPNLTGNAVVPRMTMLSIQVGSSMASFISG